jgi:hypothetical protein
MSTIYIVVAGVNYEGGTPVKSFASKKRAETFAVSCRAHKETKPAAPLIIEDSEENDAEWNRFLEADGRWQEQHPAGKEFAYADYFDICEIEFDVLVTTKTSPADKENKSS